MKYFLKHSFSVALFLLTLVLIGCKKAEPDIKAPILERIVSEERQHQNVSAPSYVSVIAKKHYDLRIQEIERQPDLSGGIIFIGDDLTENALWGALFPELNIRNQGIIGDTTEGLEKRLSLLNRHSPEQIYIMIGENDGSYGRTSNEVAESVSRIILLLHAGHPTSKIYLQSPIPTNINALEWNMDIKAAFEHLVTQAEIKATGVEFIDILSAYISDAGTLKPDLYNDEVQFGSHGYAVWASVLSRNVMKTVR